MKTKNNRQTQKIILSLIFLAFFAFWGREALASQITELSVLELMNQARAEKNLAPLKVNETLFQVASDKADDMLQNNYFAHTSPRGITPWVWFEKEGYDYKFAGENLAINFSSAESQQKAWMESEMHRKNILDTNFTEVGLAVKKGFINGKLTTITVQEFGTQLAYAKGANEKGNNASFAVKNSLPKVETGLLKSFNGKMIAAGENLSGSIMGINNEKYLNYLDNGSATVILAVILINSLILIWIVLGSLWISQKKNTKLPASFNLYTISREEYLEFLEKFAVKPENVKTIYLEQMKLRR